MPWWSATLRRRSSVRFLRNDAGTRPGFVVPEDYIQTRFGIDYVRVRRADGGATDAPVQRGSPYPDGLEVLSGVRAGDVLVHP